MNPWLAARNILAVRLDNAGDVVMLGPALRAVKEASPEARLTLMASPAGTLAAPLLPWVDDVLTLRSVWQDLGHLPFDPGREMAFVDDLRSRGFDAALIFTSFSQTPHAAGYACYQAGIPLRAGESKEFGGAILSTELRGTPDELHQVERNLRLVEALGFPAGDRSLGVQIGDSARETGRRLLAGFGIHHAAPWVLIHPGASAAARRYPAERWCEVARLLGERGWPVLVTGVEKERESVERVAAGAPRATMLVGRTTMAEYAALVEGASVVLCGNTLPMHLADAARIPVVVLFSGTDLEVQWAPRATASRLLRVPTPCHPCSLFACPIGLPCLDILPEQVVEETEALLEAASRESSKTDAGASVQPAPGRRRTSQRPPDLVRRIAVIQALGLGDFLCLTPALRALRSRFPGATLTFIGSPWAEEAIRRSSLVDRFLPFPGWSGIEEWPVDADRIDGFLKGTRAERFDLAVQMHGSGAASNGFAAALGADASLGFQPSPNADERLTLSLPWVEDEPEVLRWLRLVELVGAERTSMRPEFSLFPPDEERAAALLATIDGGPGPLVVLHAGAKDPARRWPAAQFALLAVRLRFEHGARIVLTGGPADQSLTASITADAGGHPLDLAGRTDLGALAALLARCDLLVSNDTGASHLAAAVATPTVVLFGPARPERWAPLDHDRHRIIDAAALLDESDRTAALARLPVAPVLAAAVAQLAAFPAGSSRPSAAPPLEMPA